MSRLTHVALGLAFLASTLAQTIRLVNPPTELILNDRRHPVTVAYSGVRGQADIHIDMLDSQYQWVGGGMATVTGPAGEAKVPIEVRVSPDFTGKVSMRAFIAPVGQQFDAKYQAVETTVSVSKVPTDAIGVACQPTEVVPGRPFTLNLWYTQTHAKESDIIAVALHADTKQYFGGFTVPISQQQGTVSGKFDLRYAPLNAPLKFKAWISPRGEEAPNYVSYTMLNIHLGQSTHPQCADNGVQGWTPQNLPPANWVELKYVPPAIGRGSNARVAIAYNLVTAQRADMDVSIMTWNWDTHEALTITGVRKVVTSADDQVVIDVPVPRNAQPGKDGIYIIAYMTKVGGTYEDSYGEDRKYKVRLGDYATTASDRDIETKLNQQVRPVTTKPATPANQRLPVTDEEEVVPTPTANQYYRQYTNWGNAWRNTPANANAAPAQPTLRGPAVPPVQATRPPVPPTRQQVPPRAVPEEEPEPATNAWNLGMRAGRTTQSLSEILSAMDNEEN